MAFSGIDATRPAGWFTASWVMRDMERQFDLVVLGTGAAASTVAFACREAQVAIIDSLPFGGTCELRGCDPKKVLVGAAEALDWGTSNPRKGLSGG